MDDAQGYNCEQVESLRDVINTTAKNAGEGIVQRLHDDIIVRMSTAWYAPEAVEFFEGFAETVKASGEAITEAFENFKKAVETAGANWAEATKGQTPSLAAIDTVELDLSVADIKDMDESGNVIIYASQAQSVADSLEEVEEGIKSDLQQLAADLDAETAFIGGGQASAIQTCFVTLSGEVYKIFQYLTVGEDSLQSQIKLANEKYGSIATETADAFNNSSAS